MGALSFQALPALLHARREPVALALEDGRTLVVGAEGWVWDEAQGWKPTAGLPPEVLAADRSSWSESRELVRDGALRGARGVVFAGGVGWRTVDRLPERPAVGVIPIPGGASLAVGGSVPLPEDESPAASARCALMRAGAVEREFRLHHARIEPTLSLLEDGRVLVTGGHTFQSYVGELSRQTPVRPVELIDLKREQVTLCGPLAVARWGHAVALHPGGAVVVAGGSDGFLPGIDSAELGLPSAAGSAVTPFPRRS